MAIKDSYPSVRPSLDLNFASSRIIDPRITFTRASSATYFDEKGVMRTAPAGVPRIDFDPVTGECKGLLIEEQRTNLLTYSEQLDNAAWTKIRVTVATNATTAPDGTLTADKLVEDTTASTTHGIATSSFSAVSGTPYTFSVYLRASDTRRLQVVFISAAFGTNIRATFNVVAGTVVTNGGTATITPIGAGFYRCAFTATATATVTTNISLSLANADTADLAAAIYTGDGTSGIYIWGAQLEAGSFPTSYIKTEASQVTRAADNASMLGENFSSWYRQDEGTFVVGWRRNYTFTGAEGGGAPRVFTISDDALTILLNLSGNTSGGVSEVFGGSGTAANLFLTSTVVPANTPTTFACAYKENDCAMVKDGGGSAIDTSYLPATSFTRLYLGNRQSIDRPLNGHISRLAYYPRRLVNEQLQSLTV